ncbi:AgmX/PglI C-terminal domain-containing protein [Nannocystis sp. SCPEA4]|uniref:AgmX/PglI C-terminal domain-containing protein n=1 Tax=Nannocystis sp. SCPEA4 TaxID=2996787 RepID=UPI00226E6B36|nr:AgmX/PglI C-terminal domain-containing protein [Nannocystis sp. SCPEA4]MCY1055396.1 AgmX/PglI C-terminal domain-containing protein [Nannocystis sp. SCPEA4]
MRNKMFSLLMLTTIVTAAAPARADETLYQSLIRRVVRAHLPEVRTCYNEGLARKPELAGKLTVDFEIGTDGHVISSKVKDSTLADATVEGCVAATVQGWLFVRPDEGTVKVSYPFEFAPG